MIYIFSILHMAVMHLLVSVYSEGKMHEPYFYTDKQLSYTLSSTRSGMKYLFSLLKKI